MKNLEDIIVKTDDKKCKLIWFTGTKLAFAVINWHFGSCSRLQRSSICLVMSTLLDLFILMSVGTQKKIELFLLEVEMNIFSVCYFFS